MGVIRLYHCCHYCKLWSIVKTEGSSAKDHGLICSGAKEFQVPGCKNRCFFLRLEELLLNLSHNSFSAHQFFGNQTTWMSSLPLEETTNTHTQKPQAYIQAKQSAWIEGGSYPVGRLTHLTSATETEIKFLDPQLMGPGSCQLFNLYGILSVNKITSYIPFSPYILLSFIDSECK